MKDTTDVWFASYLVSLGHTIESFEVIGRHKGRWMFKLDEEAWKAAKIKYISSDVKKIEEIHKKLKDLLY